MSENLFPTWVIGSVDLTEYPFSVDRDNTVDIGEPEMVVETLASQLADGDLERTVRYGNRAYVIPIYIEGPTLADVADAEALLRAQLRRDGLTLTHNPGDSWAVDSVYEVQTAKMTPARDDRFESHLIRKFTLTLTCGPFARSAARVVTEALAPPAATPTTATINDATSTTGWSAGLINTTTGISSPAVVDLGADGIAASGYGWTLTLRYTTTTPISLTGTEYITVEMSGTTPTSFYLDYVGDSAIITPISARATTAGTVVYVLPANPARSLDGLEITYNNFSTTGSVDENLVLRVYDVSRTDTIPQISSRQISRIVPVSGTERTPASLAIASADGVDDLGMTVVHTSPEDGSGYSPPLRRWRTSGAASPTPDAATMSGAREPITLANPFIAVVPNNSIPEGGYLLAARMRVSAAGTAVVNWATETVIDGTSDGYVTDYATVAFPNTGWFFVPIAVLTLPSVRSYSGNVKILLSSTTTELDEAWLFRVDDGSALTVVHNTVKPRLWLDSPDVSSQVPRIWVGSNAARTDASHPGANLYAHGNHTFTPDAMAVFVGTSGTEYPSVTLTHYPRWHSNAAS